MNVLSPRSVQTPPALFSSAGTLSFSYSFGRANYVPRLDVPKGKAWQATRTKAWVSGGSRSRASPGSISLTPELVQDTSVSPAPTVFWGTAQLSSARNSLAPVSDSGLCPGLDLPGRGRLAADLLGSD